jgi:glycosyltransferase involved in cell wall biosynthesis
VSGAAAVSVVVPFHNAEQHLEEALTSLIGQTAAGGWEVVAVNNRSTDRSRTIVESFSSRLPLTMVDAPRVRNASYARNTGVAASRGARLLFMDADDAIAPGYVDALSAALDRHPFVTSRVDSETLNPDWVRDAHGTPWQADGVAVFFDFLPATGVNIGIRRELFDRLGGFSECFATCEDIALSWQAALDLGVQALFVPDALYRYRYRSSLPALYQQSVSWGRGTVRLFEHFRAHGMPGRTTAAALLEWKNVAAALARARTRRERAAIVVRLGYCAGRLVESVRRRVAFF